MFFLFKKVNEANHTRENYGMIQEEVALYEVLSSHDTVEYVLGDKTLRAIALELTKSIKENASID